LPSSVVTAVSSPPPDETRQMPDETFGVKKMVSCASQLPVPLEDTPMSATSASETGSPPLRSTFFSLRSAKNPTHWPSGEKNGAKPPSVPGIGVSLYWSISRK
jgi:hypothetical protein